MCGIFASCTAALLVGSASTALAADIPVKAPAPAPVVVAPAYNWSGFYIGIHGGYSWQKVNGFYDQNDAAGATDLGALRLKGFVFGGQIGYNWQMGGVVFGVEADGSWAKADDTVLSPEPAPRGPDPVTAERNFLASIRGRAGFGWERILLYGTAGVGFTRYEVTITETLPPSTTGSTRITKSGFVWGGGAEFAITPTLSLRGEFLQYRLGTTLTLAPPTYSDADPGDFIRLRHINVVRGALNYRFGGPVVARY